MFQEYKISSMCTNLWSTSGMKSWNTEEGHWHSPIAGVKEVVKLIWDRRCHWSGHRMVMYPQIFIVWTGNTLIWWWRTLGRIGNYSGKQSSPNFRTSPVDQGSTQLCWTNHGLLKDDVCNGLSHEVDGFMMEQTSLELDSAYMEAHITAAELAFCYWLNLVG